MGVTPQNETKNGYWGDQGGIHRLQINLVFRFYELILAQKGLKTQNSNIFVQNELQRLPYRYIQ